MMLPLAGRLCVGKQHSEEWECEVKHEGLMRESWMCRNYTGAWKADRPGVENWFQFLLTLLVQSSYLTI